MPSFEKFNIARIFNKNKKKTIVITEAAVLLLEVLLVCLVIFFNGGSYSLACDDNVICTVGSKYEANQVLRNVVNHYTPKDTSLKAYKFDKAIEIIKTSKSDAKDSDSSSVEEATDYIISDFQKSKNAIKVTISSAKTKEAKYVPTPKYIKDDNMVAGDSKVVKKGKDGKQKVSTTYTSVNGKIKSHSVTNREVIDKGKKATVKKGTIGLPKGKDWRTFTGAPVFKNGEELSKVGLSHLGAPYRYGGSSFVTGIDCVQFVRALYRQYGIYLPGGHSGIQHTGRGVSLANARKGDIVCYRHHMGIYIGNGKMVNALHGGVGISRVKKGKLVTIRRVVK